MLGSMIWERKIQKKLKNSKLTIDFWQGKQESYQAQLEIVVSKIEH